MSDNTNLRSLDATLVKHWHKKGVAPSMGLLGGKKIRRNLAAGALVQLPEDDWWVTGWSSQDLQYIPCWALLITVTSHNVHWGEYGPPRGSFGLPQRGLHGRH